PIYSTAFTNIETSFGSLCDHVQAQIWQPFIKDSPNDKEQGARNDYTRTLHKEFSKFFFSQPSIDVAHIFFASIFFKIPLEIRLKPNMIRNNSKAANINAESYRGIDIISPKLLAISAGKGYPASNID